MACESCVILESCEDKIFLTNYIQALIFQAPYMRKARLTKTIRI